jgi:hypothetical protein
MDRRLDRVNVPEWGGWVYIRTLSADESIELQDKLASVPKERYMDHAYLMLGACLSNAKGEPLFATEAAIKQLGTRDQEVLLRLQKAVAQHVGVVATEKNASGEAAPAASPTA